MTTSIFKKSVYVLFFLSVMGFTSCSQLCQATATTAFTTYTGQQWRLVSTTDPNPNYKSLTNYNTQIFTWNTNFTGSVAQLSNNTLYDNPPNTTFAYTTPTDGSKQMQVTFTTSNGSSSSSSGSSGTTGTTGSSSYTTNFSYTLSTELDLTDETKGYTYRLVPFLGIVNPDQTCTF